MNMVVCVYPGNMAKYLFRVPDGVTLEPGTLVAVDDTMGRENLAVCASSTFESAPEKIKDFWGKGELEHRVVKVLREFMLEWPDEVRLPFEPDEDAF